MNYFVIGYYALLIGSSCVAAYFNKREAFLLLFTLTLASFVMGIVGGESTLWGVTLVAGAIGLAAGTAYAFREFLAIVLPREAGKAMELVYIRADDDTTFAGLARQSPVRDAEDTLRLINGYYPRGEPPLGEYIKIIRQVENPR